MDESGHEFDVFVSFAADDDASLGEGGPGCVAALCTALHRFAKIHLGRDLTIALSGDLPSAKGADPAPAGARVSTPETAALFVAVLSPTYVAPASMDRNIEAEIFAAGAGDAATSRMFTVVTEPVEPQRVLKSLRNVATYDLFDDTGASTLMVAASDLARDVAAALGPVPAATMRSAETTSDPAGAVQPAAKSRVFLAHTDDSLRTQRDEIRTELKRRGFEVVPDGPPGPDRATVLEEAAKGLEGAVMSVHLLSGNYDEAAHLECEQAGQAAGAALERMVWLGGDEDPADPVQRALYQTVEAAPAGTQPFRRASMETFKTSILEALETDGSSESESKPEPGRKYVYLVYDRKDEKWTLRLERYLGRQCVVWTPLFEGTAKEIDRQHREYLKNCDASLLVYGAAPQTWWKTRTREFSLRGQPGSDVKRAYYMVEPMTREKDGFSEPDRRVIRAGERFSRVDLDAFLEELGLGGRDSSMDS